MLVEAINQIREVADAVTAAVPSVLTAFGVVTGAASALSSIWPKPAGGLLLRVHNAINLAALNIGHAKNANAGRD